MITTLLLNMMCQIALPNVDAFEQGGRIAANFALLSEMAALTRTVEESPVLSDKEKEIYRQLIQHEGCLRSGFPRDVLFHPGRPPARIACDISVIDTHGRTLSVCVFDGSDVHAMLFSRLPGFGRFGIAVFDDSETLLAWRRGNCARVAEAHVEQSDETLHVVVKVSVPHPGTTRFSIPCPAETAR